MIINFQIFERLGRIECVENITDIIWNKYKNAPIDKNFIMEDIEYGDFKIKKLTIKHFNDSLNILVD